MTQIKTLADILAEMGHTPVSAKTADNSPSNPPTKTANTGDFLAQIKPSRQTSKPKKRTVKAKQVDCADDLSYANNNQQTADDEYGQFSQSKSARKRAKRHQATPAVSQVASLLDDAKQGDFSDAMNDKLAKALQNTAIEPLAVNDRQTNYMRWLAFYYLSRRELSQHQLRQKLLAKECDADAVESLLIEFAEKNYQSDERCAHMLIRESIRKSRGKQHIRQALKDAKLSLPYSLDELIASANIDEVTDGTILENQEPEQVDWLLLAVEARCKKYGNHIPTDPKEKARQLRFLQYRGFEMQICFDALKYCPEDLL